MAHDKNHLVRVSPKHSQGPTAFDTASGPGGFDYTLIMSESGRAQIVRMNGFGMVLLEQLRVWKDGKWTAHGKELICL